MVHGDLEKQLEIYRREQEKNNPDAFLGPLPDSVKEEFALRNTNQDIALPDTEVEQPPIDPETMSAPTFQTPYIAESAAETYVPGAVAEEQPLMDVEEVPERYRPKSSFDVDVSTTTPRMEGRPESLPSGPLAGTPPKKGSGVSGLWELEDDPAQDTPPVPIVGSPPIDTASQDSKAVEKDAEEAAIFTTDNDKAAREANLAALEKRRKFQVIPEIAAGIGDTISSVGDGPSGSKERMIARHDTQLTEGKADVEVQLRNDAGSDISKQYQNLLAQMMQKDPSDTAILGMTANQIAEKIPMVEDMMQRRFDKETRKADRIAKESLAREKLDAKAAEKHEKKVAQIEDAKQQAGTIRGTIKDIIDRDLVGWDTTGPGGGKWVAPFDHPDLKNKLDTITANIAFVTLNKMRQNSPTGGAVGQVSDRDMTLLSAVKGSLTNEQTPGQLKQTLERLDEIYTRVEGYDADITAPWTDKTNKKDSLRQTKSGIEYQVGP